MFETLFSRPFALQRHRSGPFAVERTAYLEQLACSRNATYHHADTGTLLSACRQRACPLAVEPPLHPSRDRCYGDGLGCAERGQRGAFDTEEPAVDVSDCSRCVPSFHRSPTRQPRFTPGRYEDRIEAFIKEQRQYRWQSEATCRVGRGQVVTFLSYLEEQGCDLASIDVGHVDVYSSTSPTG